MSGILNIITTINSAIKDAYFNIVALLLSTTSTNGAQNNTFLDSSSNNYSITRNGNTTQGTFTPFSQTKFSVHFVSSYLTATDTASLRFGSSNFTIEAWVYRTSSGAVQTIASKGAASPTGWQFQISVTDKLVFTDTSTTITGATSLATNTWYYVAVVRAGTGSNQTTIYLNGSSDVTGTSSTNFNQTDNLLIGANRSLGSFPNGYISNLRLSNTNRTISSVPTLPLTADANTIFLALNTNSFQYTDSTAAFTNMAVTGTPAVQAFSPFAPNSAYNIGINGGSGYFDGTGDYLVVADAVPLQFGSGTFTINCWVYRGVAGVIHTIAAKGASTPTGWVFQINASNQLVFTDTSTSITSTTTIPAGAWTYVSAVRSGTGSSQTVLYINAVSSATGTSSTNFNQTSALNIGADRSNANTFNGYISGFEYIKGSALTPSMPTSPPTTVNSPSLLLNYTNAGIFDAASKSDIETVSTAQVSTTQAKFGTTSIAFNGTSDYLIYPYKNTSDPDFTQAASFTVELWLYLNATTQQTLLSNRAGGAAGFEFRVNSGGALNFYNTGGSNITTTTTLTTGSWNYIAAVKNASTMTIYINGVDAGGSGAYATATATTNPLTIGARNSATYLSGYIDELRITRGFARTVTTTPTAAFPTQ